MKHLRILLISTFLLQLVFSCKKSNDSTPAPEPPVDDSVSITSISPDPNGLHTGVNVLVTGKNFGWDSSKITLTLGNQRMKKIKAAHDSIIFVIPLDLTQPGGQTQFPLTVTIDGKGSVSRNVTITWQEPHGWYYLSSIAVPKTGLPLFRTITFPTETIGFALHQDYIYRTTDGGLTWTGTYISGSKGSAFASYDGKNAWTELGGNLGVSSDGIAFPFNPRGFDSQIIGLQMSSPVNGLVATGFGNLYKINGGFDASQTPLLYQSPYALPPGSSWFDQAWEKFSAIDESNLMIVGTKKINDTATTTIVHEKAGVFTDYIISGPVSPFAQGLQLINANAAVLIDRGQYMYKMNGSNNWTKLNQKSYLVHFLDANIGYAAFENRIIKTTDGGATWHDAFYLNGISIIYDFCEKNGKLWAIGNDSNGGFVLKCNP